MRYFPRSRQIVQNQPLLVSVLVGMYNCHFRRTCRSCRMLMKEINDKGTKRNLFIDANPNMGHGGWPLTFYSMDRAFFTKFTQCLHLRYAYKLGLPRWLWANFFLLKVWTLGMHTLQRSDCDLTYLTPTSKDVVQIILNKQSCGRVAFGSWVSHGLYMPAWDPTHSRYLSDRMWAFFIYFLQYSHDFRNAQGGIVLGCNGGGVAIPEIFKPLMKVRVLRKHVLKC